MHCHERDYTQIFQQLVKKTVDSLDIKNNLILTFFGYLFSMIQDGKSGEVGERQTIDQVPTASIITA